MKNKKIIIALIIILGIMLLIEYDTIFIKQDIKTDISRQDIEKIEENKNLIQEKSDKDARMWEVVNIVSESQEKKEEQEQIINAFPKTFKQESVRFSDFKSNIHVIINFYSKNDSVDFTDQGTAIIYLSNNGIIESIEIMYERKF